MLIKPAFRSQPPERRFPLWRIGLGIAGLALLLVAMGWWRWRGPDKPPSMPPPPVPETLLPPVPPPLRLVFPTSQAGLADTTSTAVYMPTASGRVESALYGSTRTAESGGRLRPRFHAGIDIAPLRRGQGGRPLDEIHALADGRVAYLQRAAGGSTYGRYLVIHHHDALGTFYSLYSHLDAFADGLKAGDAVRCGQHVGRMGNTASYAIPMARAHLHLEIGVIMNQRFADWLQARGYPRTHGASHGWNLHGINPLRVLLERDADGARDMLEVLRTEPVAFTLLLEAKRRPDYYRRHPALWEVEGDPPRRLRIDVAEGGAPLRARNARPEDMSGKAPRVVFADSQVLGRNGRALVTRQGSGWRLSAKGERWLDQLLF